MRGGIVAGAGIGAPSISLQETSNPIATPTSPQVTPPSGGAKISVNNGKLSVRAS
jgi:hypothetical protein